MPKSTVAEQISLARRVFTSDQDEARSSPSEPAYRLPSAIILKTHDDLVRREQAERHITKTRKIIVAAGSKHHSNKAIDQLQAGPISQLSVPGINRGKALVLKICLKAYRTSSVQFVAKDENEWMVPIAVYHASANLERLLLPETVLLIREPWLKEGRDGYIVRVDSPADIELWPNFIRTASAFASSISAEQYRQSGSALFGKKQYYQALQAYEAGIYHYPHDKNVSLLRLNAAAVYLRLGLPGRTLRHLQDCHQNILNQSQISKHVYRKALALYQLQRYSEAVSLLEDQISRSPDNPDSTQLLQDSHLQIAQSQTGNYNWSSWYSAAEALKPVENTDYVGPVTTKLIKGKGRGLCAIRAVPAGELLLVSQPLAIAQPDKKRFNLVLGLNLASESLDTYTQVDIVGQLIEKAGDDDETARKLEELYAGPVFPDSLMPGSKRKERIYGLDAGRIEGICTYNSFRPQCVTQGFASSSEQDEENDQLHSASALYHLPSMINHACIGNATYVFFGDTLVVRATAALNEGDEVLFSYCDAAAPLAERREHLKRYGFVCSCWLCKQDQADGKSALKQRHKLLTYDFSALSPSSPSRQIQAYIDAIKATYTPSREAPKPQLYQAYRLLSRCLGREGQAEGAYEADISALEALGAVLAIPAKQSSTVQCDIFTKDPTLCMQDAVISCLKLAHDCQQANNQLMARKWFKEAERLHEREFGPAIFRQRMSAFTDLQGWQSLWDLTK